MLIKIILFINTQITVSSMTSEEKILYFEYTINKLLEWYINLGHEESKNNFSVLKSLKLLFFVSAAKAELGKRSLLLEDVFTDFYALPYGHVESSVYDEIKITGGELKYFKITNVGLQRKAAVDGEAFIELDADIKSEIDTSIQYLESKNKYIVTMFPFDLVNLSHAWYSWQKYFKIAKESNVLRMKIPVESIKSENKIFSLYVF